MPDLRSSSWWIHCTPEAVGQCARVEGRSREAHDLAEVDDRWAGDLDGEGDAGVEEVDGAKRPALGGVDDGRRDRDAGPSGVEHERKAVEGERETHAARLDVGLLEGPQREGAIRLGGPGERVQAGQLAGSEHGAGDREDL